MKKPRPKKKYVPRPIARDGGLIAIARCHARGEEAVPLRGDQVTDIGVAYWLSLENLRTGPASEESWCNVACALNIGLVLCEMGIGPEYEETFVAALDGAFRAKARNSGNFRLDGDAMRDIEEAFAAHDLQMQHATRAEVTKAMQTVRRRIDTGNVYTVQTAGAPISADN